MSIRVFVWDKARNDRGSVYYSVCEALDGQPLLMEIVASRQEGDDKTCCWPDLLKGGHECKRCDSQLLWKRDDPCVVVVHLNGFWDKAESVTFPASVVTMVIGHRKEAHEHAGIRKSLRNADGGQIPVLFAASGLSEIKEGWVTLLMAATEVVESGVSILEANTWVSAPAQAAQFGVTVDDPDLLYVLWWLRQRPAGRDDGRAGRLRGEPRLAQAASLLKRQDESGFEALAQKGGVPLRIVRELHVALHEGQRGKLQASAVIDRVGSWLEDVKIGCKVAGMSDAEWDALGADARKHSKVYAIALASDVPDR